MSHNNKQRSFSPNYSSDGQGTQEEGTERMKEDNGGATASRKRNERGMNHFFVCATIRFSQSSEVGGKLEREKDTFIWNWIWMRVEQRKKAPKRRPHERACDFTQVFFPSLQSKVPNASLVPWEPIVDPLLTVLHVSLEYVQVLNFDWGNPRFFTLLENLQ